MIGFSDDEHRLTLQDTVCESISLSRHKWVYTVNQSLFCLCPNGAKKAEKMVKIGIVNYSADRPAALIQLSQEMRQVPGPVCHVLCHQLSSEWSSEQPSF